MLFRSVDDGLTVIEQGDAIFLVEVDDRSAASLVHFACANNTRTSF